MPRRSNPQTPTSDQSSELDFVILPRPSLENGGGNMPGTSPVDLQLQSQFSPSSVNMPSGTNIVTMMQYDQLVSTVRSMKEENTMLKEQLTEMMMTMESRTEEFKNVKKINREATNRCKEIHRIANEEVTRLRRLNDDLDVKIQELETKVESGSYKQPATASPESLLTQLNEGIQDVQMTRRDIRAKVVSLEESLKKSGVELKHYKQRAIQLQLEKQDLLNLNNELQTMISVGPREQVYSSALQEGTRTIVAGVGLAAAIKEPVDYSLLQDATRKEDPGVKDTEDQSVLASKPPMSPRQVVHKSSIALQDVLLQLQTEREKVASLYTDLKRERDARNRIEKIMMEQMQAKSGEHTMVLETVKLKHKKQVEELSQKLDELTVANQEPHYSMELKEQVRSLVYELQERENMLQDKEHSAKELHALNEALKSKISLYHDELENIRKQDSKMIETLRQELQRQTYLLQSEKQKSIVDRLNHGKLREEHNQLFQEFDALSAHYHDLNRSRSTPSVDPAALRELAEERDSLTAQLLSAEEAINSKTVQFEKAECELKMAREQIETIPILQAQADIYKNDFDAERAAREKAHTEREHLITERDDLLDEKKHLEEQLASHNQSQLKQMQNRHGRGTITSSSSSALYGGASGGSGGIIAGGLDYVHNFMKSPFGTSSPPPIPPRSAMSGYPEYETVFDDPGADVDQHMYGRGTDEAGAQGHLNRPHEGSQPPGREFRCPKCQNDFPDIDTLQIHMLDCIH